MDLSELLAKHEQGNFLSGMAEAVHQLIMEADVGGLIRAPPRPLRDIHAPNVAQFGTAASSRLNPNFCSDGNGALHRSGRPDGRRVYDAGE